MAQSRYYSANAQPTVLTSSVTPSQTNINVQQDVGFPNNVPFIIALDYNTSSEEVCLVTARAGTNFTVTRAYDGTSGTSHNAGAAVRHTWSAIDGTDARIHEGSSSGVHGVAGAVVGTSDSQTLTNKSLTSPTITGTVAGVASYTAPTITGSVPGNPTFTAGASIGSTGQFSVNTAGNVTATGIGAMSVGKLKAADTSRASTTTMTADPDLVNIPVVANAAYIVEGFIIYSAVDVADFKCQFTGPAAASMNWHGGCLPPASTGAVGQYIYDCQTLSAVYTPGGGDAAGNGTSMMLDVKGLLRTGANAGNFGVQWAQNVSNATATIVRTGSYLQLRRIA